MGFETYQKILSEAMEEIGIETGVRTTAGNDYYVEDCTIETDQPAFIPDDYIDINAEKIRIYKQLDSVTSDKELERYRTQMADRFGPLPPEVENLFSVVRIRNLGAARGFEKIIIKNGMMIMFFISNPMSPYYKTKVFTDILGNINANDQLFHLKQSEGKLKIVTRGIDTLQKALQTLMKLK
jgi:transcription-repair coupling factor (superfamily II helicase)